ncbi:MAG: hypothetical protein WDM91_12960 [Rhizomicrobium sp.]
MNENVIDFAKARATGASPAHEAAARAAAEATMRRRDAIVHALGLAAFAAPGADDDGA